MMERALQLLDAMQQQGLQPDVITYSVDHLQRSDQCMRNVRVTDRSLQLVDERQKQGL